MASTRALQRLAAAYPLPNVEGVSPFRFSLDGGGRELIVELIRETKAKVLIEIGSFLGGSAIQWLDASTSLTVIGVDPWEGDWGSSLERYAGLSYAEAVFRFVDDRQQVIDSVRREGPYRSACANLSRYGSRFVPVKGSSPAALETIASFGIKPDIVYIDANKVAQDLEATRDIFPKARICGDDWSWGADQGFPMQTAVKAFAEKYGLRVVAERATWVLH